MPFCDMCGTAVSADARFCPECGRRFQSTTLPTPPPPPQPAPAVGSVITESKNPGVAALLAFLVGLGLFGTGHIYVGRIGRGLVLLLISVALDVLLAATYALTVPWLLVAMLGGPTGALGLGFVVGVFLILVRLVLWIWQTYDAYKLAKQFNAHVQQYGKAPW